FSRAFSAHLVPGLVRGSFWSCPAMRPATRTCASNYVMGTRWHGPDGQVSPVPSDGSCTDRQKGDVEVVTRVTRTALQLHEIYVDVMSGGVGGRHFTRITKPIRPPTRVPPGRHRRRWHASGRGPGG